MGTWAWGSQEGLTRGRWALATHCPVCRFLCAGTIWCPSAHAKAGPVPGEVALVLWLMVSWPCHRHTQNGVRWQEWAFARVASQLQEWPGPTEGEGRAWGGCGSESSSPRGHPQHCKDTGNGALSACAVTGPASRQGLRRGQRLAGPLRVLPGPEQTPTASSGLSDRFPSAS